MIETDVLIVGGGPAGLATAIALKRKANGKSLRVVVLDKGRSPGSHILSGAIIDPSGFKGLLTDEEVAKLPVEAHVVKESFRSILTPGFSLKIPWVPPMMSSKGYPVGSLTKVTQYLAQIAVKEGVEFYTGYAVTSLVEENGRIVGARTGEKGIGKDGQKKSNYLPSEEIRAKTTVLAEGGAGILTERLIAEKGLQGERAQTYALGIKELIEVPAGTQTAGEVMHTFGYPADFTTYGGGFVYHVSETQVMVGYAYALDYRRPEMDTFRLFRRFKATAAVAAHLKDGKTVAYGAKMIPEGGYYSAPKPYYPGCMIVGDGAGLLDSLRIKGVHIALQSGMAAAEAILAGDEASYVTRLHATSGWKEMKRVRNVRAPFSIAMPFGVMAAGLAWATFGKFPCCRLPGLGKNDAEELEELKPGRLAREAKNDVPSGPAMPDRLTDVFMSGTIHQEDQPCHLKIRDAAKCEECEKRFGSPCTRFCAAEVYRRDEIAGENGVTRGPLQIDFSNCLHCKTCAIKCPYGNVDWTFPQGGDGPRYTRM
ncbi:MAG: electron transfer flavoprotein-ubiquinone oxidoreductase [Kiritimatiellae bacterium]|nr:electron transfer flavoprotein-ubiquinone oxidoreductase [Kiritimatiellia bacterium]